MKAVLSVLILLLLILQPCALAKEKKEPDLQKRMALYHKTEAATHIPWYVFAAVDQYEINIRKTAKTCRSKRAHRDIYSAKRVERT